MPVRVRMFAALREAAGEAEATAEPGRLPVVLDSLRDSYGPAFAERLRLCTVLVDGDAVSRHADVAVPDGAELALLPPVSGGSAETRPATSVALRILLGAVVAAAGLVADMRGAGAFWVVVVSVGALVLVDLVRLLTLAGSRPVVPAALVGGVGLPVAAGLRPDAGWEAVGAFTAGAFLLACLLVLLFGRRRRVVEGLSSTVLVGLMVGLGATSLIVLRALPDGHRWVLGLGLVVVAADCGPPLLTAALRRGRPAGRAPRPDLARAVLALVAALVAGVVVAAVLRPPFGVLTAAGFAVVAAVASLTGEGLHRVLLTEAGDGGALGGAFLAVADGIALAAPAAYLLAVSAAT